MQLCSEHRGSVTCAGLGAGPDQRQGCKRLLCDTTNKSPPPLLPALCSAAPARCVCALAWDGCEGGEDGWATGTPGRGDSTQPLPRQRLLSLSPCRGNSKRCSVEAGRWSSERACRWDREGRAAIFIYLHKPRRNTHKQVYRIAYLRASVGNVQMCHCAHITHRRHTYIHVHTGMAPSTTAHGATARGCGLQGGQQGGSRQGLAPPRALCPPSTLIPGVEEQSSPRRQHNNDAAPTSFLQDLLKHREHEPKHTEYKVNVSVLVTGAINLLRKVTTVQSVSQNSSPPGTKAAVRPPSALLQQPPRPPPPAPGSLWPQRGWKEALPNRALLCAAWRAGCRQRDPRQGSLQPRDGLGAVAADSSPPPPPPPLCSLCCSRAAVGMRLLKHKKDIKIELTGKLLNRSKLGA